MNKLGFAVKIAYSGTGLSYVSNKDSWINKVCEIRDYLKLFNGLKYTNNTVMFLSFDENGCYLTILRAQSGREGDYISGWLYIPNNIQISGNEVEDVVVYVKRILSLSNLNDISGEIDVFFSKEYPLRDVPFSYMPSSGEEYGYRTIGFYSLREILDSDRYQPYYSQYKAIFILDINEEVSISNEFELKFHDLTTFKIEKTYVLMPPSYDELKRLGDNVKILFENKTEFSKPLAVKANTELKLCAINPPFEPQPFMVVVSDEITYCDLSILDSDWLLKINRSLFHIVDKDKKTISNYNITIQPYTRVADGQIFVPMSKLRKVQVIVSASNYESSYESYDLTQYQQPITIILDRKQQEFSAKLFIEGDQADVIVRSKNLNKNQSPFIGYKLTTFGELKEDEFYKWKQRLIGALLTLGICLLGLLFMIIDSYEWKFQLGVPPVKIVSKTQAEKAYPPIPQVGGDDGMSDVSSLDELTMISDEALEYLDNNNAWKRESLEKYKLQLLYDDMNTFNLNAIINNYPQLAVSKKYNEIKNAAKKALGKWNPKYGDHNPTWNKGDDTSININRYVNWVSEDQYIKDQNKHNKSDNSVSIPNKQNNQNIDKQNINQGNKNDFLNE